MSAVLTSEGNERVNESRNIRAMRCRVNNEYQVLMLTLSCEDLRFILDKCSGRT